MRYSLAVNAPAISAADPHPRRRVKILDSEMAYVDVGRGDPIVFLHGNPTSSYLWRNVIPHVVEHARCLAPDLIGMGASGKAPDGSYRFVDHARYLDAWFDALGLARDVTVAGHDWGSALGFHWAARFPERVKALAYMEAIVRPVTWPEWPDNARSIFQGMRSPAGEAIILEKNVFVERILPGSVLRGLGEDEMRVYRGPWLAAGESRRPMLTWPRELPIEGEPADVVAIVDSYGRWLATTTTPKLFINAEPGSILVGAQREFCRTWPNQREVTVAGTHFVQEDSPAEIGQAIAQFLEDIR
jgi:haloalkane dehalogenase